MKAFGIDFSAGEDIFGKGLFEVRVDSSNIVGSILSEESEREIAQKLFNLMLRSGLDVFSKFPSRGPPNSILQGFPQDFLFKHKKNDAFGYFVEIKQESPEMWAYIVRTVDGRDYKFCTNLG